MKFLMKSAFAGLVFSMAFSVSAHAAAAAARGAKTYTATNYSTTISTVAANGAAVVYGVILSSGTAGTDYTVLWDKAVTGATVITTTSGLVGKLIISSSTQNTTYLFDPPLQFANGIVIGNSAATNTSTIIWERGRLVTGY